MNVVPITYVIFSYTEEGPNIGLKRCEINK